MLNCVIEIHKTKGDREERYKRKACRDTTDPSLLRRREGGGGAFKCPMPFANYHRGRPLRKGWRIAAPTSDILGYA